MPSNELEREVRRISNLINYKDIDSNELEQIAKKNIICREFKKNPLFTNNDEQKLAEIRFRGYIEKNELESSSDLDTLKSLVFDEIFEQRIQGELNKLKEDGKYPPDKLVKTLVDVQNQKASLKVKLGIDKKEDEKDDLSALQLLEKRVAKHINENKNEFTIFLGWQCEKCDFKTQESYLLYKPIKDFKILKHPFFAGKYLFSYPIVKDVKDGKLSKQDATRYLMGSGQGKAYNPSDVDIKYCEDYLDYLIDNFKEITDLLQKTDPS